MDPRRVGVCVCADATAAMGCRGAKLQGFAGLCIKQKEEAEVAHCGRTESCSCCRTAGAGLSCYGPVWGGEGVEGEVSGYG